MGIDYNNLHTLDVNSLAEPFLKDQATKSLEYLQSCLQNNVFPREDYRELLELSILYLGGCLPNFKFQTPGPVHHARFMAKAGFILENFNRDRKIN